MMLNFVLSAFRQLIINRTLLVLFTLHPNILMPLQRNVRIDMGPQAECLSVIGYI